MLTISIDTGNAAFYGPDGSCADPCPELAHILRQLASHLDEMPGTVDDVRNITDSNGNRVGTMKLGESQ